MAGKLCVAWCDVMSLPGAYKALSMLRRANPMAQVKSADQLCWFVEWDTRPALIDLSLPPDEQVRRQRVEWVLVGCAFDEIGPVFQSPTSDDGSLLVPDCLREHFYEEAARSSLSNVLS